MPSIVHEKDSTLLTIVVAVYNVEEQLLRRCLDSLIPASPDCMEVLLIDDGSTDGCPAILDEYAAKYPSMHAVHSKNQGVSGARNLGIDNAHGTWMMFVDGDDYVAGGFLEQAPRLLAQAEAIDILFFAYKHSWDVSGEIEQTSGSGEITAAPEPLPLAKSIVGNNEFQFGYEGRVKFCTPWGKFVRREFLDEHNCRFPLGVVKTQDRVFMTEVLSYKPRMAIADALGYVYISNLSSITHRHDEQMADKLAHTYEMTKQKILEFYHGQEQEEMLEALVQMRCVFMYDALDATYLSPTGNPRYYREFREFKAYIEGYLDCIDAVDVGLIYGIRNKYLINCLKHRLYRPAYYGSALMMDVYLRMHR